MSRAAARAPAAEPAPAVGAVVPPRPGSMQPVSLRPAFDVRVTDDDPVRAAATVDLLRRLSDALGLNRAAIHVRTDAESGRIVRPHAARGALANGVVRLDPARFNPRSSASRYVLAHELTHLAQSRITAPQRAPTLAASEREAHVTALALVATGTAPAPRQGLPAGITAFDAGAEKAVQAEPVASFEETVGDNYAAELEVMREILGRWVITDGAITTILQMLEPLAFETATTLVSKLTPLERKYYVRNFDTVHRRSYRREVLASYAGVPGEELARFDQELFEDMSLKPVTLTAPEWHAAVRALRLLPAKALTKLDDSDNAADIRTLRTTPMPEYDAGQARKDQHKIELARGAALASAAGSDVAKDLLDRVRTALHKVNAETAGEALDILAGYDAGASHDPRFARPPGWSAAAKDGDAKADAKPAAKPAEATPKPLDLNLNYVIAVLDGEGLVEKLVDAVSDDDRYGKRRPAFLALLRHRRPDRNLTTVRDLLSSGFLNWVRDAEAKLAYDILITLPPAEQDRFRRLDEGELFRRLYDELPADFKHGEFFHGLEVRRDANGQLVDVAEEYGRLFGNLKGDAAIKKLIEDFEAGVTKKSAYGLFVRLLAIGRAPPGQPRDAPVPISFEDQLRAVVRHLDARGFIQTLFGALDPGTLQDRRYWEDLRTIFSARDPAMNARHARDLLHDSFCDSLDREEALLAFQIFRSLPGADREELSRAENGKMWERLTGKLTREMVQELGLSYARTTTNSVGENALRMRLADPKTWEEANLRELALLSAMEISAGDFDWLFWQSRAQRACDKAWLKPLVARFELFDDGPAQRTSPTSHVVSAADGEGSYFKALFGTRAYELDFHTRTIPGSDPFTGEAQNYQQFEGMRATVDLEQLEETAGGWLATNYELKKSGGKRIAIDGDNREQALAQSNVVDVVVSAEKGMARLTASRLDLSRFAFITPAMTVRTGPLIADNLFIEVHFADKDLREPNSAKLAADKVEAQEIVATKGDDVYGAQKLAIFDPRMEGAFEIRPMPDSPVLGPLFGFVWNLIFERAKIGEKGAAITSLAVSVSNMRLEGLQTSGGLSIAAVSIEGAAVAMGGNRAAYKRALRTALVHRLATAQKTKDAATAANLTKKIADIDAELPALERQETELIELIRQMNRAGGKLEPADEKRLAALQEGLGVGAAGGMVADIGAIKVEGVDGPVRLREGTMRDISGGGETTTLAFKQMTDAGAIEKFMRQGPPDRESSGLAGLDGGASFGIGNLSLLGLAIPTAIPSSDDLRKQIVKLNSPPLGANPAFGKMRKSMSAVLAKVVEYERLRAETLVPDAANAFERSPESQRRINQLTIEIGEMIDLKAESLSVTGPALSLGRGGRIASAGLETQTVTALGISKLGLTIDKAEATGFGVALNLDWPDAMLGDPMRSLLSATGHAKSLVMEGITSESGLAINRLGIQNFNGAISVETGGIAINGLKIERIDVTGAEYASPTQRMWSHGTTVLSGLDANIFIPFKPRDPDAKDQKRGGVLDADFSVFKIVSLGITTIEADLLGYESLSAGPDGGTAVKYRVEVESGALGGVKLTNFNISMPPGGATEMDGDIDIATFAKAKFSAAYGASLTSSGTLDRAASPQGIPGVHVGFVRKGPMTVDLNKLQFTGTDIDLPNRAAGRGLTITRTDVSGSLAIGDTATTISGLHLDRMELSRVDWKMASGATVKADGKTVLEPVDLSVTYRTLSDTHSEFQIDRFRIGKMTGTHLVYKDPPLTIELTDPANPKANALEMNEIVITDLVVGMDGDKTTLAPSKDHKKANIGIGSTRADFVADYAKTLKATGQLRAGKISVGVGPNGEIGARTTDLNLSTALSYDDKKGTKGDAKFDANIDDLSYAAGVLSIGGHGGKGLTIPTIATSALAFENPQIKLDGGAAGSATLTGIETAFDVNLHRSEDEQKAEGTPFKNIVVRRFNIDKVSGTGLHIHLKDMGIHLDFPPEKDVHVGPVSLISASASEPPILTITPTREVEPGVGGKPGKASIKWGFSGLIELKNFAADRAQMQISSLLNARADLSAQRITIGFPAAGGTNIDVYQWAAKNIAGYTANDPRQTIKGKGLKGDQIAAGNDAIELTNTQLLETEYSNDNPAKDSPKITLGGQKAGGEDVAALVMPRIRYDTKKNEVEIDPITMNGFTYHDDDLGGTTITINKISTDDQKKISAELATAGGGKKICLPHVKAEDVDFEFADLSKSNHPSKATSAPGDPMIGNAAAGWINDNPDLFAALTGNLHVEGGVPQIIVPDIGMQFDYGRLNLDLPIRAGEISFVDLEAQAFNSHGSPVSWVDFLVTGTHLQMGLNTTAYTKWFLEWDLASAGEVTQAGIGSMGIGRLARAHAPLPATAGPTPLTVTLLARQFEITNLDLDLHTDSQTPITINVDTDTTLVLEGDGLKGFQLEGALQPVVGTGTTINTANRPGQLRATFDSISAKSFKRDQKLAGGGNALITTGVMEFGALSDTTVDFAGWEPHKAKGKLKSADIRDIEINLSGMPRGGPDPAFAPLDLDGKPKK